MSSLVAAGEAVGGGGVECCGSWRCAGGLPTNEQDTGNTSNVDGGEMEQGGEKRKAVRSRGDEDSEDAIRETLAEPLMHTHRTLCIGAFSSCTSSSALSAALGTLMSATVGWGRVWGALLDRCDERS